MPVSKKPRRKATPTPPQLKTAAAGGALPDRRAMESYLAAITGRSRDDAIAKAQEVMYDAWERTTSRSRTVLAHKALAISPLCADAYNLLAEEAGSVQEARDLYTKGVEAGELALGAEGFDEYAGHFWGFLETRPYMRARAGLAIALMKLGEEDAAIGHFRAMLELNPNDNQGVRYLLLGCLLRRDDAAAVKKLLAAYEDEWSACWLYTRALVAFRDGHAAQQQAVQLVQDAWSANQHVPAILVGTKPPVASDNGYITMGGADEATDYVRDCGPVWHQTPGAVAWLNKIVATLSKKPSRASDAAN
jgi:tetratricopeptide (TPR) repeat protein